MLLEIFYVINMVMKVKTYKCTKRREYTLLQKHILPFQKNMLNSFVLLEYKKMARGFVFILFHSES